MRKLTQSEVVGKIKKSSGGKLQIIGDYQGTQTKAKFKCGADGCGHVWSTTPTAIFSGSGCPRCANSLMSAKHSFTHDAAIKKLKQVHGDSVQLIGNYKNSHTKTKFKCGNNACGHEWQTQPSTVFSGCGCSQCGIKKQVESRTFTHDTAIKKIKQVHGDKIKLIGSYKNSTTKTKFKCCGDSGCGSEWETTPKIVFKGGGCMDCGIKSQVAKKTLTHKQVVEKIKKQHGEKIKLIGDYQGARTKARFKCDYGHEWEAQPSSVFNGTGCPKCNTGWRYGYNDIAKQSYEQASNALVYLVQVSSPTKSFLKVGITLHSLKERYRKENYRGGYTITPIREFPCHMITADRIEKQVIREFASIQSEPPILPNHTMFRGRTECFTDSATHRRKLLKTISNYVDIFNQLVDIDLIDDDFDLLPDSRFDAQRVEREYLRESGYITPRDNWFETVPDWILSHLLVNQ